MNETKQEYLCVKDENGTLRPFLGLWVDLYGKSQIDANNFIKDNTNKYTVVLVNLIEK